MDSRLDEFEPMWTTDMAKRVISRDESGDLLIDVSGPMHMACIIEDDDLNRVVVANMEAAGGPVMDHATLVRRFPPN